MLNKSGSKTSLSFLLRSSLIFIFTILTFCSKSFAWGIVGHEIVATIAQTQLHPDVREHLCSILPPERTSYRSYYPNDGNGTPHQHCHLAPFAAWPDRVHGQYPWSSHLHYVNPIGDLPPSHCTYGQDGWKDHGTGNVLEAIVNYTSILKSSNVRFERDLALRFLTHFIGDSHQPLHLTGLARGGNDVHVRFNGRFAKLHSVWDSLLLNDEIRDLENYTTRLPSTRIESALLGKNYDAYIRWILAEGLGQARGANGGESAWWADESETWSDCPDVSENRSITKKRNVHWLRKVAPHSSKLAQRVYSTIFRKVNQESIEEYVSDPSAIDDTDLPVCPFAWTKPMHPLVCSYGFASPVPPVNENSMNGPLVEINVPEYAGRIHDHKILHRQLARAGIRLAAVLNTLLLPEAQQSKAGISTIEEDDSLVRIQRILSEDFYDMQNSTALKKDKYGGKHGGHHTNTGGDSNSSKQSPIFSLIKVTAASIAEVVILASVGYLLARQGVLDKRTQTKINKVNVSFFTPALLFSKVAFSLDPGRLAELIIVPVGFVLIIVVSGLSAILLSWMARLSKSQRNFSIACAITPNSNSLPVALMQSLVVTVPQLHWEEDGEPEDTVNGMLGRALTYLVLFSTLGMFLRWSLASQLLSTMDDADETTNEEPVTGMPTSSAEPSVGRLIDHDSEEAQQSNTEGEQNVNQSNPSTPKPPKINVRKSTEDGGGVERVITNGIHRQPGWARSFPNSPGDSEEEDEGEGEQVVTPRWQQPQVRQSYTSSLKRVYGKFIKKPINAILRFMTMPLYAALLSLIVAMIPPLQALISGIEPLVGALETAGACSIPLTIVVLGAYFYEETDSTKPTAEQTNGEGEGSDDTAWQSNGQVSQSTNATLVNANNTTKRKSIPFMRNPWKNLTASESNSGNGSLIGDSYSDGGFTAASSTNDGRRQSTTSERSMLSSKERKERFKQTMERRTIAVAVGSRMVLTPILLLPILAWYAIATRYNVVDDPVFICSACLLIGSPPALTLAQITSQSAAKSGGGQGNSSFERLISKTIFLAYAILATPTTIILVLTALLIAENDH